MAFGHLHMMEMEIPLLQILPALARRLAGWRKDGVVVNTGSGADGGGRGARVCI